MGLLGDVTNALGNAAGVMSPLGTIAGGLSAFGSLFGSSPQDKAMDLARLQHQWDVEENQKNRDFQRAEWQRQFDAINRYNDPKAAKQRLMAAGLNSSAILGGQGSAIGNSSASSSAPSGASGLNAMPDVVSQVGFQSHESLMKRLQMLGDLSKNAYLLPEAKSKLSSEIQSVLADAKYADVRSKAEDFALRLEKMFGIQARSVSIQHALSELALVGANTDLAIKNGEKIDVEKWNISVDRLLKLAQKRLSSAEADRVEMELKWIDSEKQQAINESRSRESVNYSQVDFNRENRRLLSALADIEESGKSDKIQSLIKKYQSDGQISDADAKEALLRLERISQITDKRSGEFFKEIDGFTDWLKGKISIFK